MTRRDRMETALPWRGLSSREWVALGVALAGYAAMLAYMVPRHEPWADEAQAWELAKALGLRSLFGTYLHYEVSPGLWHLALWVLARLHVTYAGMHWFSAAVALSGVGLLTVGAPFSFRLRLLLPFTFYFAYQFALIGRSYVLFAPLLFALAWLWPQRLERPVVIAAMLGLIANVSAHTLVVAVGLAVVLAGEAWRSRDELRPRQGQWVVAAVALVLLVGFAAWCLLPPKDAEWLSGMKKVTDPMARGYALSKLPNQYRWLIRLPAPLQIAVPLLGKFLVNLYSGLTRHALLGLAVWGVLVWQWKREGLLRYGLPVVMLGAFSIVAGVANYHAGLFWLLLLFLWWVTWPGERAGWRQTALLVLVVLCTMEQIGGTLAAMRYDARNAYSPDRDAAPTLQAYLDRGEKVDVALPPLQVRPDHGEYYVTGLEPYFAVQPIHDMPQPFWVWRRDDGMRAQYLADTSARSVVVVMEYIGLADWTLDEEQRLAALGYVRGKSFCGSRFYPPSQLLQTCHTFYEPGR